MLPVSLIEIDRYRRSSVPKMGAQACHCAVNPLWSVNRPAAIHDERLAHDILPRVGRQKQDGTREILWLAEASGWYARQRLLDTRRILLQLGDKGSIHETRGDGIHAYAELDPVNGERLRQLNNARLAGGV